MYEMDSTDLQIIEILKEDGRASFSFIANKVHLSRVAVRERIKIMKENGIIHGFTVIIDAKAYKKMAAVFMDIEVDPSRIDAIAEELMKKGKSRLFPSTLATLGFTYMPTSTMSKPFTATLKTTFTTSEV